MQSRLFSQFNLSEKGGQTFVRDLKAFLGLPPEAREVCIASLHEGVLARTKGQREQVLKRIETASKQPARAIEDALDVLAFLLRQMVDPDLESDSTDDWAADLQASGALDEAEAKAFSEAMAQIRSDILPKADTELRKKRYAAGILPSLKSFGTTVELRAVQEEHYSWGEKLDDYKPRIVDVVGIVSVHIGVDPGPQEDFYFQASAEEIDLLIANLRAAKRDLEALEKQACFRRQDSAN